MNAYRILGGILVVVGVVLLGFAWSSTQAVVDKVNAAATGRFTETTISYLITGLIGLIGGGALWIGGRPKS